MYPITFTSAINIIQTTQVISEAKYAVTNSPRWLHLIRFTKPIPYSK